MTPVADLERAVIDAAIELHDAIDAWSRGLGHLDARWARADRAHHVAVDALLAARAEESS